MVEFDTAMRIESRYLAGLMSSGIARNMINTVFFNMNNIKSGLSRPAGLPRYRPQKVGVLGAGMMGSGIAYSQASRGIASVLKDVTLEKAEKGKAYSAALAQKLVEKGSITEAQKATLLNLIQATDNTQDLQGCDLIIEAVFEQRELKAAVTKESQSMLAEGGFFASNTSTLPISGLALSSTQPEKFVGIHFFSPVDKMKLVEIIRGEKTDDETIARAFDYVLALGKLPIVVNDSRGFYTSRTFATFVMEGASMLQEGIPAPMIENLAMQVGMPVGPLAVIDETSLTLSVHVLDQTREDFKKEGRAYVANPGELLVEHMVKELNRGGRSAGGGFYDYPVGQKKMLWPDLKKLFEKSDITISVQDIKDRFLFRQAIETARCLDEGVLKSVHEGNIGSIFGIGYPAWTGGALQFIYSIGVPNFAKRSQELALQYGLGFNVSKGVLETLEKYKPVY
jgi:3-hydroxyacyl-CoA dehydrogenase/enoyl-CoA hydratase/3-hydroxybutyryl-CoA epimerase